MTWLTHPHGPLTEATVEARSEPHWVYRMYDAQGRLLYVGMTRNPRQRIAYWLKLVDVPSGPYWENWTTRVAVKWLVKYPNWKTAALAEREAIRTEDPSGNKAHHPRQKRPIVCSILDLSDEAEAAVRAKNGRAA